MKTIFAFLFMATTLSYQASAVPDHSQELILAQTKPERFKARQNQRQYTQPRSTPPTSHEEVLPSEALGGVSSLPTSSSILFPDWAPQTFSWNLQPLLGLQYTKVSDEFGTRDSIYSEAGIAGQLRHIPIVPGNGGFYISPRAGKAWGSIDSKLSGELKTSSTKYNRTYGGLDAIAYYRFYRHTLGITRGHKEFSTTDLKPVQSMTISNDLGFLILPWVSSHLTHRHLRGFNDQYRHPFLQEQDYWLHARIFTSVLSSFFDVGPGVTLTEEFRMANGNHEKIADGSVQYLQALAGAHLFWKIGASGHIKYIFKATDNSLGNYAQTIFPEQSLNEPRFQTMPEDSLTASTFIGIRNLFAGFGIGWQYNLQILNVNKRNNTEKSTTKDHGFALTFEAAL